MTDHTQKPPLADLSIEQTTKEVLLFAILLECTKQQISALDGRFKHNAKRWINNLAKCGESTLKELYKELDMDADHALGEMYDYIYMQARNSFVTTDPDEMMVFKEAIEKLATAKKEANALGVPLRSHVVLKPIKIDFKK